jgi:hypothetical protein
MMKVTEIVARVHAAVERAMELILDRRTVAIWRWRVHAAVEHAARFVSGHRTIIVLLSVIALTVACVVLAATLAGWDYWSEISFDEQHRPTKITTDRTKIIQQFVLMIGGALAFGVAVWRSWTAHKQANVALRQADLAERAHDIDRYAKGAGMLDSEQIPVRQAGVYSLLELGRADTGNLYSLVLKLLSGFARVRSAEWKKLLAQAPPSYATPHPAPRDPTTELADLHDAIRSIGWLRHQNPGRVEEERTVKFTLNLQGITANGLSLNEVDFSLADLSEADLRDTYIRSTKFWHAYLWGTDFRGATAQWSNFEGASLESCRFEGALFSRCTFERASLATVQFDASAELGECNISGASFIGAKGLASKTIESAWAWSDDPPQLPPGVAFTRLHDPGPNGSVRSEYNSIESRKGFPPPP